MRHASPLQTTKGIAWTLVLAGITLWASIWLAKTQTNTSTAAQPTELSGLAWKATQTEVWLLNSSVEQTYFAAETVKANQSGNQIDFENFRLHQVDSSSTQRLLQLTADKAKLIEREHLQLTGHVHLTQNRPSDISLQTTRMQLDLDNKIATSDQFVTLKQPGNLTTATGFTYHHTNQTLTLHQKVKTTVIPNSKN